MTGSVGDLNAACPIKIMKFTLTYDGELHAASRSDTRLEEKWAIRRALHPQLKELWMSNPTLSRLAKFPRIGYQGDHRRWEMHHTQELPALKQPEFDTTINLLEPITVGRGIYIPLVRESLALVCGLDILFLRKEEPGKIVNNSGGDIDNRIKVLFDGLRVPNKDQSDLYDSNDPEPFYCLLEGDERISDLSIRTDRLLTEPNSRPSQVRLIITVSVKVTEVRQYNAYLIG
jgi:hypothetical protein